MSRAAMTQLVSVSVNVVTHWFGAAGEAGGEVGDSIRATDGAH